VPKKTASEKPLASIKSKVPKKTASEKPLASIKSKVPKKTASEKSLASLNSLVPKKTDIAKKKIVSKQPTVIKKDKTSKQSAASRKTLGQKKAASSNKIAVSKVSIDSKQSKITKKSAVSKIQTETKRSVASKNPVSTNTNVWDTLGIPNIKDAVRKTTSTEGFKWAVFLSSAAGIVILLIILYIAANIFIRHYKVETVFVEGNTHYTNDEIKEMVMEGPLGDNSLYLSIKYKDKAIENVPFVQRMDVEVIDAKSIRIRVYEKAIAGYFEHLGQYVYFDKDGIVIECSDQKTDGVPMVTGLNFNYVVMYEPLPAEKKEIFEDILDITQLLKKYDILADKIYFDKDNKKTLYFGKARVSLGTNENIDEKILKLKYILPKLEGLSGVLRMDNYSEGVTNITFEEDKE